MTAHKLTKKILIIPALILSVLCFAQKSSELPYKGGGKQFDADVASNLMIETKDSGRVYLVEISYSKSLKDIVFFVHGIKENDITKMLVRSFFKMNRNKWDKTFVKKQIL